MDYNRRKERMIQKIQESLLRGLITKDEAANLLQIVEMTADVEALVQKWLDEANPDVLENLPPETLLMMRERYQSEALDEAWRRLMKKISN